MSNSCQAKFQTITWKLEINMLKMLVFLVLALSCLHLTHGLYFHIGETERKCFIEEIPDETNVIGKY